MSVPAKPLKRVIFHPPDAGRASAKACTAKVLTMKKKIKSIMRKVARVSEVEFMAWCGRKGAKRDVPKGMVPRKRRLLERLRCVSQK